MARILFFAPHSALWVHAFPEALVAETLGQHGHEVVYVTCGEVYQRFCIPMNAERLKPESDAEARARVCAQCNAHKRLLRSRFGLPGEDLAARLSAADHERAQQIVAGVSRDTFLDLDVLGVPAGRLALYEFILEHKKQGFDFSETEWQHYRIALTHVVLTLLGMDRIFAEVRPDRVVVYNALYSVNRAVCDLAERRGIASLFLHAGGNLSNRLQTLMIGRHNTFEYLADMRARWPQFAQRPTPPAVQQRVTAHFLELLRGQHFLAYSSAKQGGEGSIRERYGVPKDAKVLVATLSSYDERFAGEVVGALTVAQPLLFARQVDWVNALIEFVKQRPDLFLLIRVHPREFPNRREGVKSEHALLLEEAFARLPANAKVNWPGDQVSLYDLAEEADLFLNAWSSVGKEMSLFGLPVVIYSARLVLYPPELNALGESVDAYFAAIDEALRQGWSAERVRMMYRWYALEFVYDLVDISDAFGINRPGTSLLQRVVRRIRRQLDPYHAQKADCRHRAPLAHGDLIADVIVNARASVLDSPLVRLPQPPSEAQERAALKGELAKLAAALEGSGGGGRPLTTKLLAAEV